LQGLAAQLAGFLQTLHQIPSEKIDLDLPVSDSLTDTHKLYADIRQHLFPLMRPDARTDVLTHFETYFNTPRLHTYPVSLHHGDFGGSNILYDPATQSISGIIDFGFAGWGDPALDIAAVSTYGESFFKRLYRTYPEIALMQERADFYRGTYALYEAVHGFKNQDQAAFESGMAAYI
jgi:aminoglycoside 2''-phosphotransferase